MAKTLVYRFHTWDITNDRHQQSAGWATKEAIKKVSGEAISEGAEIDEQYLGGEVDGMTARNFDPYNLLRTGFQNKVM